MQKRFVSVWFPHLATDWFTIRHPELSNKPFVLRTSSHGRLIVAAANPEAQAKGIANGSILADATAILPGLLVLDEHRGLHEKLLRRIAEWCIRFTPSVAVDLPSGLLLDCTGCTHLWGSEEQYVQDIVSKLTARGYHVRAALAGTIGAAWGTARFAKGTSVIPEGKHIDALMNLPPAALRLEPQPVERLHTLGLLRIKQFITMPRSTLRRRFGAHFIMRLDQALGYQVEFLDAVQSDEPYQERLPCMEPIVKAIGIEIALQQLLETLCLRLRKEQKGLRSAILQCYRVDGKIEKVSIGTSRPSHHVKHLFKLFEPKLSAIEPALGIELFLLDAVKVEAYSPEQENMWQNAGGLQDERLSELIDNLANKLGADAIRRYLPDEHHWPERSIRLAKSLQEKPATPWPSSRPRPLELLEVPIPIQVAAPIPDYPPMLFRYNGQVHNVAKANGPERIEQEWWLQDGEHRDYYRVEDEQGRRYWIFRLGHYNEKTNRWFLHGFFA